MASSPQDDNLAECPKCGESAMSEDTPCSRCQPPLPNQEDDEVDDNQCQNCGSHVSQQFRRVCGDNDNVAHACADCVPRNAEFPYLVAGLEPDTLPVGQR